MSTGSSTIEWRKIPEWPKRLWLRLPWHHLVLFGAFAGALPSKTAFQAQVRLRERTKAPLLLCTQLKPGMKGAQQQQTQFVVRIEPSVTAAVLLGYCLQCNAWKSTIRGIGDHLVTEVMNSTCTFRNLNQNIIAVLSMSSFGYYEWDCKGLNWILVFSCIF